MFFFLFLTCKYPLSVYIRFHYFWICLLICNQFFFIVTGFNNVNCFSCPKCYRIYKYKNNLSRHLRTECGIPPKFICDICDYRTYYRCRLTAHRAFKHQMGPWIFFKTRILLNWVIFLKFVLRYGGVKNFQHQSIC